MSSQQPYTRRATVRFLTEAEGGRQSDPLPGVRPQMKVGTIQTSCILHPIASLEVFERGQWLEVTITPVFADRVKAMLSEMREFELYEGSHRVAQGKFLE